MYGCAALRDQREALKRDDKQHQTDNNKPARALDIIYTAYHRSRQKERTRSDSVAVYSSREDLESLGKNAVSVPAPDQPAVCLQQPAG